MKMPVYFNKTHQAFLSVLISKPIVCSQDFFDIMAMLGSNALNQNNLKVQIHKLRKRLPEGIGINAVYGGGYCIVPEHKPHLVAYLGPIFLGDAYKNFYERF